MAESMTPDSAHEQQQLGSHDSLDGEAGKLPGECRMGMGIPGYDRPLEMVHTVGHNDDCLFLCAHIGGLTIDWLMDCGANPNLLSTRVYQALDEQLFPLTPVKARLTAANGDRIVTHGQTIVKLELGDATFEVPVIVADIGDTAGILGMRFLRDNNCIINFQKGTISCGQLEWDLIGPSEATSVQVKLVHQVLLPPCHEAVVTVELDGRGEQGKMMQKWEGLVEPCESWVDHEGVLAACGLALVSRGPDGETTAITVSNMSDKTVALSAGTVIATVQPVHSLPDLQPGRATRQVRSAQLDEKRKDGNLPEPLQALVREVQGTLTEGQTKMLVGLLQRYEGAFVGPDSKLGCTDVLQHCIDTGSNPPFKVPYRPAGFARRQVIEENLTKMLADGVIEPSVSPWSSPVVLVRKKDGSTRFCVDLRRLNEVTKKDAYPLPNISDCLGSLAGARWFCTLDLASGYWQVSMADQDKEKTAFATHKGLFHFRKMPFGLTNAPATFMRLMSSVLGNLEWERCLVYLDDVIVFGSSFETCISNLEEVLKRLDEAGLKLKPSKCSLFQKEVSFLGHIVGGEGIRCDPAKVAAVQEWPSPTNASEIRSFLGLANYYKRFVKNFSQIALPLTTLTQKDVPFNWDEQCDKSFRDIKDHLTKAPTLAYPSREPSDTFILDTDASNFGIGAVLSQLQDGEERVIAYASKGLTKSQRNYCTTYRELLAIVEFVPHFKHFLLGQTFQIRTDHSSLRWLHRFKDAEGLVGRWLATLANYSYTISYRAGEQHGNADAMSRHPLVQRRRRCGRPECSECTGSTPTAIKCCSTILGPRGDNAYELHYQWPSKSSPISPPGDSDSDGEDHEIKPRPVAVLSVTASEPRKSNWVASWSSDELIRFQQEDVSINTIISWLAQYPSKPPRKLISQGSPELKSLCALWPTLHVQDGLLFRHWISKEHGDVRQLVAPLALRGEIFRQLHCTRQGGHLGTKRTVAMVRARFFWPNAKSDLVRWCRQCDTCAQIKGTPHHRAKLQQDPVGSRFERVAIDIMGELPVTEAGNRYILVISDYFTKWTQAFPLRDMTAQTVADTLINQCFSLFGMPRWLHSDQGSNFESELFSEMCKLLDIRKTRTTPYHPQSDGMVERFNRTCQQMIKAFINENRDDWDDHLPLLLMAYRSSPQESTGMSPNLMMFGEELPLPIDVMVGAPPRHKNRYQCRVEYVEWLRQTLSRAHDFARQHLGVSANRQKSYYNRKSGEVTYPVGTFVWYWYPPKANRKLGKGWTGPYRVMAQPTDIHYLLQRCPTEKPKMVHVNKLKPHLGRAPTEWHEFVDSTSDPAESTEGLSLNHNCSGEVFVKPVPEPPPPLPNGDVTEEELGPHADEDDGLMVAGPPASTADGETAGNKPVVHSGETGPGLRRSRRQHKPPERLIENCS